MFAFALDRNDYVKTFCVSVESRNYARRAMMNTFRLFERRVKSCVPESSSSCVWRFLVESISHQKRKRGLIYCLTISSFVHGILVALILGYGSRATASEHSRLTVSMGHLVLIRSLTSVYTRFIRYFAFSPRYLQPNAFRDRGE